MELRNLNTYNRSVLALELKPLIEKRAKKNQGARTDISQKSVKSHDTQKELAAIAGVSHDTIHKVEAIEKAAAFGRSPPLWEHSFPLEAAETTPEIFGRFL